MSFEVELKYRVDSHADLESLLRKMGAEAADSRQEQDLYFQHPARSFAETDEALRVRRVGERVWITYKGPKLDKETKTRLEIEPELIGGDASFRAIIGVLEALSFRTSREVMKRRIVYQLAWEGSHVEVCFDMVDGLGSFVELEIQSTTQELQRARENVIGLAKRLGLEHPEPRSYLEMLLEQDDA